MRKVLFSFLILPLLIVSPAAALTTSDCFDCHSDDSLTKTVGEREVSLYIDEEIYSRSVHGDMDCTDCHEDLADVEDEHDESVEPVECANCHDDTAEEMSPSVHTGRSGGSGSGLPRCADCHGKHSILPRNDRRSMVFDLNVPATCCACHASTEAASESGPSPSNVCGEYEDGMHGIVLIRSGLIFSAVCNDCHGSHDIRSKSDPSSRVADGNVNATCSSCHTGIVDVFAGSIHGKRLAEGSGDAPICTSCHSSHATERAMDASFLVTVTDRCSECHPEEADTFRDTYHGQVTGMGYAEAAQCPDCHGAHDILPGDDPASRVYPDNLPATCGNCHAGANESFTQYLPHADYHDADRFPQLYYVYLAMVVLLFGVFFFFGIHTLLWFIRAYIEEKGKRA
ncbi:MAG: hypothetical protein JSV26_01090 [bacterium]|nr:MAG: hypothetical protein JSV26_01090 [bacterium]